MDVRMRRHSCVHAQATACFTRATITLDCKTTRLQDYALFLRNIREERNRPLIVSQNGRSSRLYLRAVGHLRAAGHLHEDSAAKSRFQLNSNVWIAIPKPIIQWPIPHDHISVQHLWLTCLSCRMPWAQTCPLGFRQYFYPIDHKCGCRVHLWESTSNSSHSIDHGSECLQRIWGSLHHHTVTIQMQCKSQ